jgi:hypothetical protein
MSPGWPAFAGHDTRVSASIRKQLIRTVLFDEAL